MIVLTLLSCTHLTPRHRHLTLRHRLNPSMPPEPCRPAIARRIPLWLKRVCLGVWLATLTGIVFVPTHFLLARVYPLAGTLS